MVMTHPTVPALRWGRSWLQSVDQPQDFLEQVLWHRDLGHLEDGVASVVRDLCTNLHKLLSQAGQRPLCDRLGQGQRPHEVGEVRRLRPPRRHSTSVLYLTFTITFEYS